MIKHVVFDWNGTLLSDTKLTYESNRHTNIYFKRKPISITKWRELFIIPLVELYIHEGWTRGEYMQKSRQIADIFKAYYEPRAAKVRTRQGTKGLLEWLKSQTISSAILSNHPVVAITKQLQRLHIQDYFTEVLGQAVQDAAASEKLKENRLALYLKRKRLKRSEVVIVGDSVEEIEIGKNLGLTTIALTGGFVDTKRLREAQPDFLIHNLKEVITILKKYNRE